MCIISEQSKNLRTNPHLSNPVTTEISHHQNSGHHQAQVYPIRKNRNQTPALPPPFSTNQTNVQPQHPTSSLNGG